jgi:cell shape-determining protein MreC
MSILIPIFLIALLLIPAIALSSRFEKKRFSAIADAMENLNDSLQLVFQKPAVRFLHFLGVIAEKGKRRGR